MGQTPVSPAPPAPGRFDLLGVPVFGPALGWRHSRTVAQAGMLAVALLLVLDGFFGPQLAHRNWAGVLPWVHWRGLVVLALLVAGNLFCFACPFMLPRRMAKRLFPADRPWPALLRSKWLAVVLLVLFFWAYEAFDLWASPLLTAWMVVAYFALAFAVDGIFRGAAFCKHVCPIGQFHFVHSTLSPLEVSVRDPAVCTACRTKDCIRGRPAPPLRQRTLPLLGAVRPPPPGPPVLVTAPSAPRTRLTSPHQSGCELWLFQPRKVGNMDCTFCLECVQACPHDNVGIHAREPGRELWDDPLRSGVGRFSLRPDLAAMALVLVAAAFVNAFGMTAPVRSVLAEVGDWLGSDSELLATTVFFAGGLLVAPAALAALAAGATRMFAGEKGTLVQIATRHAWGLVPVGFGMWLAHYLYHFLTGALTVIPVGQLYLRDLGLEVGTPRWTLGPVLPEGLVLPVELLLLETGLLVSLLVSWRIAERLHPSGRRLRAALSWMLLAVLLSGFGIWLLVQPMDMRGTLLG